jgi:hypothetical protein
MEEKRMSEERIVEHFQECRLAIDNSCATLSVAQLKLKRNGALLRQMKNLKRKILSLRRTNKALQLQMTLNKEDTEKLDDPIICIQLDSSCNLCMKIHCAKSLCRFCSQQLCSKSQNILCRGDNVVQNTCDDSSQPYGCNFSKESMIVNNIHDIL